MIKNSSSLTQPRRRTRPNSFTLVELLVAVAILAIMAVALVTMTGSIMNAWQLGQANNERRAAARAVLDRISRDLRVAALPGNRTDTNSLQMIINPSGVSAAYTYPQSIFFQAPVGIIGTAMTNGNLAIVGYFVQWVTDASGNHPDLCRMLISPSDTTNYTIYSAPTNWVSDTIISSNAPASQASSYQGLMAENVLGLWIQALDANGNPIQQTGSLISGESFDSRLGYAVTNGAGLYVTNAASAMPAAMQVAIMVVDSRTARHLAGTEKPTAAGLTGNMWNDINTFYSSLPVAIKKGAVIQSTTVEIENASR